MGGESGAPGQSARSAPARRPARYGMRWRARDARRGFTFWLRRMPGYGFTGLGFTAVGLVLLPGGLFLGRDGLPMTACAAAYLTAGIALFAVARSSGRRTWRR
jgi:hypothetical protein